MTSVKWFGGMLFALAAGLAPQLAAQVQTDVPPPVAGAKPVTVEHIKVHGAALEGNLEGDAADRDVFVFLPPELPARKIAPLSRRVCAARLLHRRRAMEPRNPCARRRSKAPSRKARKK